MRVCQGCPQCHHLPSSLSLLPPFSSPAASTASLSLPGPDGPSSHTTHAEVNMTCQLGAQKSVSILYGPRQPLAKANTLFFIAINIRPFHPTSSNLVQPCPSSPCLPQPLSVPSSTYDLNSGGTKTHPQVLNCIPKRMSGHTPQLLWKDILSHGTS